MAGLVTKTSKRGTGSGYANQGQNFKRFTVDYADWPIPFGCTFLVIECIGAGGGGGDGGIGHTSGSGGGGGGGALARMSFPVESLGKQPVNWRWCGRFGWCGCRRGSWRQHYCRS